jgi:hypothetical protein
MRCFYYFSNAGSRPGFCGFLAFANQALAELEEAMGKPVQTVADPLLNPLSAGTQGPSPPSGDDSGQASPVQQQVDTQGCHGQAHGDRADAPGGMHHSMNRDELGGNHRLNSLGRGRTWLAGTAKVGKRPWLRGKRRSQTQSLKSSTLTT